MSRSYGQIRIVSIWKDEDSGSNLEVMSTETEELRKQPVFKSTDEAIRWIKKTKLKGRLAIIRVVKEMQVVERTETFVDITEL